MNFYAKNTCLGKVNTKKKHFGPKQLFLTLL